MEENVSIFFLKRFFYFKTPKWKQDGGSLKATDFLREAAASSVTLYPAGLKVFQSKPFLLKSQPFGKIF